MRTLALRRIFFLGVMGWGDGDSQVSRRRRRRRRTPELDRKSNVKNRPPDLLFRLSG